MECQLKTEAIRLRKEGEYVDGILSKQYYRRVTMMKLMIET